MAQGLLAAGRYEPLPTGYRLVKQERQGKKVLLFGPTLDELGRECLVERAAFMPATLKAQAVGFHVVIAGYQSRHPLYSYADEYWGIRTSPHDPTWTTWFTNTMNKIFGNFTDAIKSEFFSGINSSVRQYCPLPEPSPKATDKATEIAKGKPYVTIATRKLGHPPRDLHAWPTFINIVKKANANTQIISTTPKNGSFDLAGITYLADHVNSDDLMDVELALHAKASCCVTTNTGAAGLMLYAGAKTMVIAGGADGYPPGWLGMRDEIAKHSTANTQVICVPGAIPCSASEMSMHQSIASDLAERTNEVISRTK